MEKNYMNKHLLKFCMIPLALGIGGAVAQVVQTTPNGGTVVDNGRALVTGGPAATVPGFTNTNGVVGGFGTTPTPGLGSAGAVGGVSPGTGVGTGVGSSTVVGSGIGSG